MKNSIQKTFLFLFFLLITFIAQAKNEEKAFNVVFIGNSITHGACLKDPATQAPPIMAVNYLNEHQCRVKFANCGVSGSTTVDWLPATNNLFPKAVKAADTLYNKGVPMIFSIMIGTNDSAIKGPNGSPVSPEDYKKNLLTIIDSLLQRYPQSHIILNRPIWYSPNTHNTALYMAEGLTKLQTYTPMIIEITKLRSKQVCLGDTKAFEFFKKNSLEYLTAEKGNSGTFYLHPNALGAKKLGEIWAKVIKNRFSE